MDWKAPQADVLNKYDASPKCFPKKEYMCPIDTDCRMLTSSEWQGTHADQLRFADRGVGGLPWGCGCCTNGFEPDLLL